MLILLTPSSFLSPTMAEKYGLDIPAYEGLDQIVEVGAGEGKL